jgi:hypothetical protein
VPTATRFLQGGGVPATLIVGGMLGGATGIVLALAALAWIAIASGRKDDLEQTQRLQQWASTFRCGRCGTVFAVVEPILEHQSAR